MPASEITRKVYRPSATVGLLYAKVYGSAAPLTPVGNVLELVNEFKEDVEKQDDMTILGGGIHAERRRVTDVSFKATIADLNVVNLTRALLGTVAEQATGAVTDAPYTAHLGGLIPLPHASVSALVVKKGAVTVAATNYELRPEGIWIPSDAAGITEADPLLVSYTYADQVVIEALTTKAAELTLRFGGLNEVDGGKPVVTDMWRVSQGVTKQLAHIISKGFGKLEVEGSLMKDPTKTGAGISQYMRTTLV